MSEDAWRGTFVRLRDVEPEDWEWFHELDQDTEASRFGWQIHFPRSKEAAREWAMEKAKASRDDHNHFFAIVDSEGRVVGSCNTHGCDARHRTFAYGISIDRRDWGKGYAADAIAVLLRYMFDELGYARVQAEVYAYNDRSLRMHEKFGMVREGVLRSAHYTNGERHDVVIFGMTADEFREKHAKPDATGGERER